MDCDPGPLPGATRPGPVLAVFDLDGTLTRRDSYLPFLFGLLRRHPQQLRHLWPLPAAVMGHYLGLRDNGWLKDRFLGAFCRNLPAAAIRDRGQAYAGELLRAGLRQAVRARLERHLDHGHTVVIASASLDLYVEPLARQLGAAAVCSRTTEHGDRLAGANCYGIEKLNRVRRWRNDHRPGAWTVAYTDHHSDLPLLQWADHPVAVAPTARLLQITGSLGLELLGT